MRQIKERKHGKELIFFWTLGLESRDLVLIFFLSFYKRLLDEPPFHLVRLLMAWMMLEGLLFLLSPLSVELSG